jgi:predicted short-subunit dehydrogenase-like oxidoreductase (DUF2520 family)
MAEITIIGAGRLGTSLGRALARKGHKITALTCRSRASARESRQIIGQGKICGDNASAANQGRIIFLCLPDDQIKKIAAGLARAKIDWSQKLVFHTSGLLAADVLDPLKKKGALTASFHPAQSFARKDTPSTYFQGIYFGLEGERKALVLAGKIARQLGGFPFILRPESKPSYHAACSLASNFLVILLDAASRLLNQAGIEENKSMKILFPLVEGTLHNVKKFDIPASLTGPVIRGDVASVKAHLDALLLFPSYAEAYRKLGLLALQTARKRGFLPKKIRALKSLLEGK